MFSFEVVLYLSLGGLGGGLSVVAGIAGFSIPRQFLIRDSLREYLDLMRSAFVFAAAFLLLGSLFLLADSGNHRALVHLFFSPNLSYLSIGAWAILVNMVLCLVLILLWRTGAKKQNPFVSRTLHGGAVVAGLVVALYTGLFLASMKAVPLWNTGWLPALFVLSSLSCGIVIFLALIQANNLVATFSSFMRLLAKVDIIVVLLELLCAAMMVIVLVTRTIDGPTSAAGVASALDMVSGKYAWVWWAGLVGLGIVATLLFDVLVLQNKNNRHGRIWSTLGVSFCAVIGAFSLRLCVVAAGAHPALEF